MRYRRSHWLVLPLLAAGCMNAAKVNQSEVHDLFVASDQVDPWVEAELARVLALLDTPRAEDAASTDRLATALKSLELKVDRLASMVAGADASSTPAEASAGALGEPPGLEAIRALKRSLRQIDHQRETLAENIAHAFLPGYKRRDSMPQLAGSSATRISMLQGTLRLTGNSLDLAVEGEGFFEIVRPDGTSLYRRAGALRQSSDGRLVTPEGYLLASQVVIPPDAQGVSFANDGSAFAMRGHNELTAIGMIELVRFPNAGALAPDGPESFIETRASGSPVLSQPGFEGTGLLRQGYLEMSNVRLADEVIELQRLGRQRAAILQGLAALGVFVR
ncbi:MAG: flagellar basal body rod C-terminal domain-containing protein [Planctomycetota bacterium]